MPFEQEQHHGIVEANLGVYWLSLRSFYKKLGLVIKFYNKIT